MSEDEIIGLKSTSVKFKKNINVFVGVSYSITIIMIAWLFKTNIGINFFSTYLLFLLEVYFIKYLILIKIS